MEGAILLEGLLLMRYILPIQIYFGVPKAGTGYIETILETREHVLHVEKRNKFGLQEVVRLEMKYKIKCSWMIKCHNHYCSKSSHHHHHHHQPPLPEDPPLNLAVTEEEKKMLDEVIKNGDKKNGSVFIMNGCQGIIKKIWFSPGANLQKALPSVVFVECDGYTGNLHCLNKNVK
jgi:hypothetical protein